MTTTSRYNIQLFEYFNRLERKMRLTPLNLGGVSTSGGGGGSPPGGFIGQLPQTRVAYDITEASISGWTAENPYNSSGVLVSGSLLDNLNHIRYRLGVLEGGDILGRVEVYDNGVLVSSGITIMDFHDGLTATQVADSKITITVPELNRVKVSSNDSTSDFLENKLVAGNGITLTTLNDGGNEDVEISSVATFIALTDTPATYSGQSGKFPSVNGTEDGLNFISIFSGASHNPVTVGDTSSVDLTLADQHLTATVLPAGVDHGSLAGLSDDDHPQYFTSGRHDTTTAHGLGTVVPHDSLNGLTDVVITSPAETEVLTYQSGNWVNAVTSGAHAPVTIEDSTTINLTLSGQHLTAEVNESAVDHGSLGGLTDDDHTQYLNTARHDTTVRHTLGTVVPHDSLGGLSNVTIAGLADNHIIRYNASTLQWENEADIGGDSAFTDLVDTPSGYGGYGGNTLVVKATEDGIEFVPASGIAGAQSLDELTDVVITTPVSGEVIKYNGLNWVNGTTSGTAGTGAVTFTELTDTPGSYVGYGGYTVIVNSQEDGLTYLATASGTLLSNQALFAVEGDLTVTSNPLRIYNNFGGTRTITKVQLSIATAPTGSAVIVDVNKNGTTIFTTQANRPQIAAGANAGNTTTIDVPDWADGEYLTMDVDQIGSSTAGSHLVAHIVYTSTINSSQHDAVTVADTSTVDLTLTGQHLTADVNQDALNHAQLQNIGTKTHDQIDTHINDTSIHWTQGAIDHGNLGGLTDDDHTQYLTTTRHQDLLKHTLGVTVPHDQFSNLEDVTVTSGNYDDILVWQGSWVNQPVSYLEANLDHGSLPGLTDDDHTQYLNTARHDTTTRHTLGTVVPHDTLNGLGDVTLTSPLVGQALVYNGAQWINDTVSGGGGAGHDPVTIGDTASLNLTLVGQYLTGVVLPAGVDHGGLSGKGDDDHTQYLNNARHDTTTRHTLGTVVPHDDLDGLTDVVLGTPVDGEVLKYDGINWVNDVLVISGQYVTTIQKSDATVASNVTTLNFEGNVDVIDEGGNKVTIAVTVSGAGTLHDPVTVGDTASVDLTLSDQHVTAEVIPGGVDHDSLLNTHNLTTDIDHSTITNNHNLTTDIDHNTITNAHNLTSDIDHGSIMGLADDDHTQYLNTTRHDTTARHTLGTVVPHDDLDGLSDVVIGTPASGEVVRYNGSNWINAVIPEPGAGTFLELTDTPSSYTGEGDKYVIVKATEDGLSFTTSGGGSALAVQKDDSPVASNVTIINFEGTVDATDDGGGKVTITASGTGGGAALSDLNPLALSASGVADPGTGIYASRYDHLHSIVTTSDPTGASILASDSNGRLLLQGLGVGPDATSTDHLAFKQTSDLDTTLQVGVESYLEHSDEVSLGNVVNQMNIVSAIAGSVADWYGNYTYINTDGGQVNAFYGNYILGLATSTNITDFIGLYVENAEAAGQFTNVYGVYIGNLDGVNRYSFYGDNDAPVSLGGDLEFRQSSSITTTVGNVTISPALRTIVDSSLVVPTDGIYVGRTADAGAGNVGFTGGLLSYKGGTAYTTYGFRALTTGIASTNFYGTAINGAGNYNINTEFVGVPSNAKSLLLSVRITDAVASFVQVGPNYAGRWCLNARVQRNNTEFPAQGTVPVDNGQIYIATNEELDECYLVCYGYTI